MNMVYFNPAMASSPIDQTIIFNEDGKADEGKDGGNGGKDEEKNPDEEDCE